jgi:hypothetical protein
MTALPTGYIDGSTARLQFKRPIEIGDKFAVLYPFLRCKFTNYMDEDQAELDSWKPGIEMVGIYPDDSAAACDDHGWLLSEIIGIYKPGRFPRRVFWQRKWQDPDGRVFGGKLQITTEEKFRRLNTRYQHDYELKRDLFPEKQA